MNLRIGRYMSKATGLWNSAKEAYRAAKGLLSKNERNATTAQAKKERGPVKAMFHITKNENVPAIERQGLVANNPNANINSAYQPFSSVGVKGGGNWVTDQPTAFPVYGTTVGGKYGNEAARRDALTTFKIEFPVSKLPTTRAVRDPYGNAKLTTADKGWSPFDTWAGVDVNTMAILEDIDPKYLKNIGYVEESNPAIQAPVPKEHLIEKRIPGREYLSQNDLDELRSLEQAGLNKADRAAMSYMTGHDVSAGKNLNVTVSADLSKSPARFVEDYLNKNQPIMARLPEFPEFNGWSPTAIEWTRSYKPYTKPGESSKKTINFLPGAYSRGMGRLQRPNKDALQKRHFNWNTYLEHLNRGDAPEDAAYYAAPKYVLDWDNIVYNPKMGYTPNIVWFEGGRPSFNRGHISDAPKYGNYLVDAEGNEMLAGDESLSKLKELIDVNGPQFYTDELNNLLDDRYIKTVKDVEHPTWQEALRAIMKLRYLKPLD